MRYCAGPGLGSGLGSAARLAGYGELRPGVLAEGEARQCELQGNLEPSSRGQIKQSGMTAENFDEGLLSRSV